MATPDQIAFTTGIIRAQYPQMIGLFQIPELANILTDAMMRGASPGEVDGAIYASEWYKNTPSVARNFIVDRLQDPITADNTISVKAEQYRLWLQSRGIPYDWNQIRDFAAFALQTGTPDERMFQEMVSHFAAGLPEGDLPGTLGTSQRTITGLAAQYGVSLSDQQTKYMATSLLTGATTDANIADFLSDQAKSMYPYLSDYIDQGITPRQFADPYFNEAAKMLEINPAQMDLTDPKWGRVLQPNGGAPLTLYDWQRVLRTDPGYGYDKTTQARETSAQFATQLARTFGAIG